jgi:hypothetical protein
MIAIAGSAISAGGALMQGKQAEAAANLQAQAQKRQALQESQASAYERDQERHRQELAQSAARASGVALSGSPAEVLAANARQGELDVQAMRYGTQLRSNALNTQAGISQFSGRQARQASYIAGASTLLSGVGSAVRMGQSSFK